MVRPTSYLLPRQPHIAGLPIISIHPARTQDAVYRASQISEQPSGRIYGLALTLACQLVDRMRHKKGLVGMGDLIEPAKLGVEVTTQQEVGGHLGGTQQLVHQSKKGVNYLRTWKGFTLGRMYTAPSMAF